jgi:hypothetical protein
MAASVRGRALSASLRLQGKVIVHRFIRTMLMESASEDRRALTGHRPLRFAGGGDGPLKLSAQFLGRFGGAGLERAGRRGVQ